MIAVAVQADDVGDVDASAHRATQPARDGYRLGVGAASGPRSQKRDNREARNDRGDEENNLWSVDLF